jgi:uncharacterized protein YoaH (UPF0181 family)
MPLLPGKANTGHNIKELMSSGYPQKQSVAIALSNLRKNKKKRKKTNA